MKKIKLTQGKVALVDDCDYEYLNQWKWHIFKHRNTFYAKRNSKQNKYGNQKTIYIHRVVMQLMDYNWKQVDHRDGNGLNNQRKNLRNANGQNQQNSHKHKDNTSGHKGVWWVKREQKWQAEIGVNGIQRHLGYFGDLKDAAQAYNKAALKYHGEFARLNSI